MRKLFALTAVALSFTAATAFAASAPNNVGCGLGSKVWEGESGLAPQVLAATTNGTLGNQTFGISTGTLGCSPNGEVSVPDKMAMFIGPNMNRLAQDMSRGEGETLASLADLMQIDQADRPVFYSATQQNFTRIMPTTDVTAGEVVASLNAVMSENDVLKHYVQTTS